jgi:mRNA interferase MazF
MAATVPGRGDFVAVSFDPQSGREQQGRRPALVISKRAFNRRTGLCIVCPVTNGLRKHPLHVAIPTGASVSGVVMVEQVKSIDYGARGLKRIGPAPVPVVDEVLALLDACIY